MKKKTFTHAIDWTIRNNHFINPVNPGTGAHGVQKMTPMKKKAFRVFNLFIRIYRSLQFAEYILQLLKTSPVQAEYFYWLLIIAGLHIVVKSYSPLRRICNPCATKLSDL